MYLLKCTSARVSCESALDESSPQIKLDILSMITQYLKSERYFAAATVLQDEANMHSAEQAANRLNMKRLRKAVLEGAWDVASGLIKALNPSIPRSRRKRFLYSLYKQEYIELIERQEYQKAFTYLTRKLKPLESAAASDPQEFMSLCYLLTCKRVQDCAYFSNWEGEMVGREKLIDALSKLVELDTAPVNANLAREMPPQRLVTLLRQSAAYQVEFARYHPECTPQLRTLCKDYQCSPVPNAVRDIFVGATGPLKAVTWIGDEGFMLAAAGADSFLHIWTADPGAQSARLEAQEEEQGNEECTLVSSPIDYDGVDLGSNRVASPLFSLMGHSSRVWDLASNADGSLLASVDASGCAKLWRLPGDESLRSGSSLPVAQFVTDMHPHQSDAYSVEFHPEGTHIVSGGHDRTARLVDISAAAVVKTFTGHTGGVLHATSNAHGNLIVTGSRDSTIRFWDVLSGVCVKTYSHPLGAVTGIDVCSDGVRFLSTSRYGPVRLWDLRSERPLLRLRGHENASLSFLRATFAAEGSMVLGGSECGRLHIWDASTGSLSARLEGHAGPVLRAMWSDRQSMAATCSEDGTVRTFWRSPTDREEGKSIF